MQMEYRYDDQGYPLGKTTKSNDKTLSVSAPPSPVDCQLIIVDEGVKPAVERVYTIKNTIDYY